MPFRGPSFVRNLYFLNVFSSTTKFYHMTLSQGLIFCFAFYPLDLCLLLSNFISIRFEKKLLFLHAWKLLKSTLLFVSFLLYNKKSGLRAINVYINIYIYIYIYISERFLFQYNKKGADIFFFFFFFWEGGGGKEISFCH